MNKAELVAKAAETTGRPKKDVEAVYDALFDGIVAALKAGEPVRLAGFGAFERKDTPARPGRNPRTGETIEIAARNGLKFKAAKPVLDALA